MTRRSLVAIAAVAGLAALLAAAVHARGADSTKVVPWHQIGDAGLNTTRAAVVARYGAFKGTWPWPRPPKAASSTSRSCATAW